MGSCSNKKSVLVTPSSSVPKATPSVVKQDSNEQDVKKLEQPIENEMIKISPKLSQIKLSELPESNQNSVQIVIVTSPKDTFRSSARISSTKLTYVPNKTIGQGAYGKVFLAEANLEGKSELVAVKKISLEGFDDLNRRFELIENVRQEVKIMKLVASEFVVKYYTLNINENKESQPLKRN